MKQYHICHWRMLRNIYDDGEFEHLATICEFRIVQKAGKLVLESLTIA